MTLWLIAGALLLAVVLALLAPLVRRQTVSPDRSEHGFEVLRDQLGEVERDPARVIELEAASYQRGSAHVQRILREAGFTTR